MHRTHLGLFKQTLPVRRPGLDCGVINAMCRLVSYTYPERCTGLFHSYTRAHTPVLDLVLHYIDGVVHLNPTFDIRRDLTDIVSIIKRLNGWHAAPGATARVKPTGLCVFHGGNAHNGPLVTPNGKRYAWLWALSPATHTRPAQTPLSRIYTDETPRFVKRNHPAFRALLWPGLARQTSAGVAGAGVNTPSGVAMLMTAGKQTTSAYLFNPARNNWTKLAPLVKQNNPVMVDRELLAHNRLQRRK